MGLYKFTTQGTEFDLFQGINDIISLCLKHQLFIIFPVLSGDSSLQNHSE